MELNLCRGSYERLGVTKKGNITYFTMENKEQKECELILYPAEGEEICVPLEPDSVFSRFYSIGIWDLKEEEYAYNFRLDGKVLQDPYALKIIGREEWGNTEDERKIKCGLYNKSFSWEKDVLPEIPKEDMVIYKLHVRGFSMLLPKEAGERGTVQALRRRIPYLKSLGITTLELMPVYEFEEIFARDESQRETFPPEKINYWGYTRGNYFAPKSAYLGAGGDPAQLKQLIKSLHKNGMECILEFYFDEKVNPNYIIEVLRYWAREYHVDGFHVIGTSALVEWAAQDSYLSGRKLFFDWFPEKFCGEKRTAMQLFSYNDDFAQSVRRVMNRQGGSLGEFTGNMRRQQLHQGFVNYIASNNGFTLYDLFAYTSKQNQGNQEENTDGTDWNYSSNCGEEGPSRKRAVNDLRYRQIKNAMAVLTLAQGVPLIWMGDECGNSQLGNNNAYCQDNEVGWKSWKNSKRNRELTEFLRHMLALRRKYPILHKPVPMELSDYKRRGYPDLSYHGERGWQIDLSRNDIAVGMLYSNKYEEKEKKLNEDYIYIGYNFTMVSQELALPALTGEGQWHMILNTGQEDCFQERLLKPEERRTFWLGAQSVCILVGSSGKTEKTGEA